MKITCPSCATELRLTIASTEQLQQVARANPDITPLTEVALRDIYDVLVKLAPFHRSTADLYAAYMEHVFEVKRARPLTKNAFARGLGLYGAERWRTTKARGFHLDEAPRAPLGMSHAARERFEAAHQRQLPTTPQPATPDWDALPFAVEPPRVDGDGPT